MCKKLRTFRKTPCKKGCVGNIKKIGSTEFEKLTPGKFNSNVLMAGIRYMPSSTFGWIIQPLYTIAINQDNAIKIVSFLDDNI